MRLSDEDTKRFDELYRKHQQDVFRTCLRFAAGDDEWAIDRSQEVFVKLAHNIARLDTHADLGGWLYRVSVNACLVELRRQRRWRKTVGRLRVLVDRSAPSFEQQIRARRDLTRIERAIALLPPKQHTLMALMLLDGKTQSEAVKLMKLSKGQISKLHTRAMTALRAMDWESEDV